VTTLAKCTESGPCPSPTLPCTFHNDSFICNSSLSYEIVPRARVSLRSLSCACPHVWMANGGELHMMCMSSAYVLQPLPRAHPRLASLLQPTAQCALDAFSAEKVNGGKAQHGGIASR
jgi:hypothetical protein